MTFAYLFRGTAFAVILCLLFKLSVAAGPPPPETAVSGLAGETTERLNDRRRDFQIRYRQTYAVFLDAERERYKTVFPAGQAELADTFRVPVILVDFPDYPSGGQAAAGTPEGFDSVLFSSDYLNPTGSLTEYFLENSYGSFYVTGDVYGWYVMPQSYGWYVADDYGLSLSRSLAVDAVTAADGDIDFSVYDADRDGVCDAVIIVHAGPGAEEYGEGNIWSHRGWLFNSPILDGVTILDFAVTPEEYGSTLTPVGPVCREFGRILNLPDLYDVSDSDGRSGGLGRWSLMASGAYNNSGRSPAHLDAWCKIFLGFMRPIKIETNLKQAAFPLVEYNPVAYLLSNSTAGETEYWIAENRGRVGFDTYLPGEGLLIYHIDDSAAFCSCGPCPYRVALEQADGLNELASGANSGDSADPWPGESGNADFHDLSRPNSRTNIDASITEIGIWNISEPGDTMYADLDISFSRPYIVFEGVDSVRFDDVSFGNGNTLAEPGETVELYVKLKNYMLSGGYAEISLSVSHPDIRVVRNKVALDHPLTRLVTVENDNEPLIFEVSDEFESADVTFTLALSIDSALDDGFGAFLDTLEFTATVGTTDIIVVGSLAADIEKVYKDNLLAVGEVVRFWDSDRPFPVTDFLDRFKTVFRVVDSLSPEAFPPDDIAVLKSYLDRGGNLCMVCPGGVERLVELDSVFVADYFGFNLRDAATEAAAVFGVEGNPVGEGVRLCLDDEPGFGRSYKTLLPSGGGENAFELEPFGGEATVGVSYDGAWRSLFLTFPIETVLDDKTPIYNTKADLFGRIVRFMNGGEITGVGDENDGPAVPKKFTLSQNYPNPFNPSTVIKYSLADDGDNDDRSRRTRLVVYNMLGQKIRTLVDEIQPAGTYEIIWDGADDSGKQSATGVYLYRLERGGRSESRKMLLLK